MTIKKLCTVGILSALAIVLNMVFAFIGIRLSAVSFLTYDPADIVNVIVGFIFGPLYSLVMSIVTSFIELTYHPGSITDAFMNIVSTCTYSCTAAYIYKKMHSKKGAIIGLVSGSLACTASMIIWNIILTPIFMGWDRQAVLDLILPGFLPFNLIKCGLNTAVVLIIYKPVITIFRNTSLIEDTNEFREFEEFASDDLDDNTSSNTEVENHAVVNEATKKKHSFIPSKGFLILGIFLLVTFILLALVLNGTI